MLSTAVEPKAVKSCQPDSLHLTQPIIPGGQWSTTRVLRNASEFDVVFKRPDGRSRTPAFLILMRKNERQVSRLGMVISKKNVRKAVDRNRIKRQIRSSFRQYISKETGVDVVVLAQKGSSLQQNKVIFETLGLSMKNLVSQISRQGDHQPS